MWVEVTTYNQVYSAFAFISFVLCCISLPLHWQSQNSSTVLLLLWVGIACLNQFINSVVWNGNVINWAPIWCDISTHLIIGGTVAIPATGLCISRRICQVIRRPLFYAERADRCRALCIDLAICVGFPVVFMALYTIPQGVRFTILEDIGCAPAVYVTPVAILIMWVPPVIISLASLVYSILALRLLRQQRKDLEEVSRDTDCYKAKITRLVIFASFDACLSTPINIVFLVANVIPAVRPWVSWADTHANFWQVGQVPAVLWRDGAFVEALTELSRWIVVSSGFLFFGLFGFTREAREGYKNAFSIVSRGCRWLLCLGRSRRENKASKTTTFTDTIRIMDNLAQSSPNQNKRPAVFLTLVD